MAQSLRSQRNVPPSTIGPSKLEQPESPEEETLAPNNLGLPDAPAPDAPVLALVCALASIDELFKQFIKAYLKA